MKYIAIIAVLALLFLTAGCAMKTSLETADATSAQEQTELSEDLSALDEELAVEDIEIDTAELESLDM